MKRELITTNDGSCTLFVPEIEEHYHSVKGACTESQHIFIKQGLKASTASTPRVLEIGFGTGLNALLTLIEAEKEEKLVHYTSLELYPLNWELIEQLDYPHLKLTTDSEAENTRIPAEQLIEEWFEQLHQAPWNEPIAITKRFSLHKVHTDITLWINQNGDERFDVVYFDAFSPEKQPELWTPEIFGALYAMMKNEGVLVTYCAKGVVRRSLQNAGFKVERLPGPPNGKREILRATRL